MNEKRMAVIKHAYQFLDAEKKGFIPLKKLVESYNGAAHPRVRTREKKVETVMDDFVNSM